MSEEQNFDEIVVVNVEQRPHLYDKKRSEFKDKGMKENSWAVIAEICNSDVETVKKRWENLRDRFVRAHSEFLKAAPSGSGADVIKTSKVAFPLFQQMLWLVPYIRKRKLVSTSMSSALSSKSTEEDTQTCVLTVDVEDGDYSVDSGGFLSPASSSSNGMSTITPKARKDKLVPETLCKAVDSFSVLVQARVQQSTTGGKSVENSSDMNFMRSVVDDMQGIPLAKRIKLKREIMELLEKYITEETE